MRAEEFVNEGKKGKLQPAVKKTMNKTHLYSDGYHADGTMNFYRIGLAAAMADGTDKPVDIDERTWFSTNNVAVPFTDTEHKMMHQAFRAVKSNLKNPVSDPSTEPAGTNKQSPVRAKSKNQYGV